MTQERHDSTLETLTPEIITAAIEGLTAKQEAIGRQIAELQAMLPGGTNDKNARPKAKGRSTLSAEARERIAAAQRRRWAAAKGEAPSKGGPTSQAPKKRRMSAAARKRIAEATRSRWAAYRKAKAGTK